MKRILLIGLLIIGGKAFSCNVYDTINRTICPEDSILFNGVYLKTAGTYYDTFNISLGCDTFRTLNLSVHSAIAITPLVDSFCPGYPYSFNSKTYSNAGNYYDTLNSVNGCDSVILLALSFKNRPVVFPAPRKDTVDSFCRQQIFDFQGKTYSFNVSGLRIIRDTVFGGASNGCDSINQRAVFIRNNNNSTVPTQYACRNKPFVYGDSVFYYSLPLPPTFGFKSVTFRNKYGCDSIVSFNLRWRDTSYTPITSSTCANHPFLFQGNYYTAIASQDTLIKVVVKLTHLANGFGTGTLKCDSFVELFLTVRPNKFTIIDTSLCDNHTYFFKGQYLRNPGTYLDTQKTINNCDSFITLNILTPRRTSRYTYYRKFCSNQTVFFNQTNIDQPGTYNDTLVNSVGCDSFLTMVLTKDTAHNITMNKSICSYDSFYFDGKYLDTAGTYIATFRNKDGCDSMVTLNLSVYPFRTVTLVRSNLNNIKTDSGYKAYYWYFNEWTQLNVTGNVLAANTTGSYHVIAQDENNCRFKSNVYVHNPAGISGNSNSGIQIYPNPTRDIIHIESLSNFDKNTEVKIYSMDGKLILSQESVPNSNRIIIDLNKVIPGLYMLRLESENNTKDIRIEKR